MAHGDIYENGHIFVLTAPAALEVNPIDEDVWIFLTGKLSIAPYLDMSIGFLIEIADSTRRNLGPPEYFGDVVCDTVKVPTVIVQNSPSHRGNLPIKSGTP